MKGTLLFMIAALFSPLAFSISVEEVVQKANEVAYYQGDDGKAKVHMSITDAQGRERSRDLTILRKNVDGDSQGAQKFYVYFSRPADVNKTAFLVWKYVNADDDRWLYLPALDLVKRIAASDERTSFVGSHFFYEDVSGRSPGKDKHTLIEETDNYYVLKSEPVDSNSVEFTAFKSWIHKATFLPVKIEYYDDKDTPYRRYEALSVDTIDGYPTVTEAQMTDLKMGGKTNMVYSQVGYNIGLPDDVFTERYLRTAPRKYLR